MQNNVLVPVMASRAGEPLEVPLPMRVLTAVPPLQRAVRPPARHGRAARARALAGGLSDAAHPPVGAPDQAVLWEWLHVSLWDPPPAPPRPREVLDDPRSAHLRRGLGPAGRPRRGRRARGEPAPIGACWMRLMPRRGLAYVDAETPQLGIALFPASAGGPRPAADGRRARRRRGPQARAGRAHGPPGEPGDRALRELRLREGGHCATPTT